MMKKIIFITLRDAEYGFRLAGVEQFVAEETDIDAVLRKAMREPDAGMIAVDERLLRNYPLERLKDTERSFQGVFLVLPAPTRPAPEAEDYASRLIRQAIGYHVRLKL